MFDWYRRMGRIAQGASWAGALFAVVVSGAGAYGVVEPILPAHRGYVRSTEQVQADKLAERLIVAQLDINKERRERLLDDVQKRELELQSPEVQSNTGYQALIKERVERVKKEIDKLDANDKSLFDEQTEEQKRKN